MAERQFAPCLLSLDGGGVKGITTLLILREIFKGLKKELGREVLPCEVFDLIGGTSTGGLIAVMLGVLRLSIDECLEYFEQVSESVFVRRLKAKQPFKWINAEAGGTWFEGKDLEDAVKKILETEQLGKEMAFIEEGDPKCKVFVTAVRSTNVREVLIRSYRTDAIGQQNYDCSIWEAARATSAAPLYFESITLRSRNAVTFIDGGIRANNPIELVLKEAYTIWDESTPRCILSIGTGWDSVKAIKVDNPKLHQIAETMSDIATDSEAISRRFESSKDGKSLKKSGRYFRFNVQHGMEGMELYQVAQRQRMIDETEPYMEDVAEDLKACSIELARGLHNSC